MVARRAVPILRIPFSHEDETFFVETAIEVLRSGVLTLGPKTEAFEDAFARFVGVKRCVAVANGTAALELILRALGIQGRSVVVPTNTFFATPLAVMHAGNRVIFADSDPSTLCLNPKDLERRIEEDTGAVILVHIAGIVTPHIEQISSLCEAQGLALIEDCAHAHGSTLEGRGAGTFGVAGAFSFFPTKVLTTGEGGAITIDDEDLYRRLLVLRNQGKDPEVGNRINDIGFNYRLSEITAALGLEQVRRAQAVVAERRSLAALYDKLLTEVDGITALELPKSLESSYYKYVGFLDQGLDRTELKTTMRDSYGVALTGEVYSELCHEEPVWSRFAFCGARKVDGRCPDDRHVCPEQQGPFPGAEQIAGSHVCLPLYPGLTDDDLTWVVSSLQASIYEQR